MWGRKKVADYAASGMSIPHTWGRKKAAAYSACGISIPHTVENNTP
jgi:hypothetical protein